MIGGRACRAWAVWGVGLALGCAVPPDDTSLDDTDASASAADRRDADADGSPASRDCDDGDAGRYPGNPEVCDGVDNDCDGDVDDADATLDLSTRPTWFEDRDRDGFGGSEVGASCGAPSGAVAVPGDCDDRDPRVHPAAPEICNERDDDCDLAVDDADEVAPNALRTWYVDVDGDGFGVDTTAFEACDPGAQGVGVPGDCADDDALVHPGAGELCNGGVDDDCDGRVDGADDDVDPASVITVYNDLDGDGFGAGAPRSVCTPGPGTAARSGDCDDGRSAVFPGALEVCDGRDNDCEGGVDEDDAWWDAAWPYRKLVTVTAPAAGVVPGLPWGIDVDLGAELTALGDASGLDPASIRVVAQRCALGQPRMPAELADGVSGAFGGALVSDGPGDGQGTLLGVWDDDEDPLTADAPSPGATLRLGVYFGSRAHPAGDDGWTNPGGVTALGTGAGATLDNGLTRLDLAVARGGLASRLSLAGLASVGTQTTTNIGNGVQFTDPDTGASQWVSVRDAVGTVELLHAGAVAAVARSSGVASGASGGFSYVYDWLLFDGRPEVWVRVRYVLDRAGQIGPVSPSWSSAVRPWFVNNAGLVALGTSEGEADAVGFRWARGAYDTTDAPFGVVAGWLRPPVSLGRPVYDATGSANAGRYVGLVGQGLQAAPGSTFDGRAGDVILDGAWLVVLPHAGAWAGVAAEAAALFAGATVTSAPTTRRP